MLVAICGTSYGFFWGSVCDNMQTALMFQDLVFRFFSMGAGAFINLESSPVARFFSYISPVRCSAELIMRRICSEKEYAEFILWFYDYEYGDAKCFTILIIMVVAYFLLSWIITAYKAKYI